MNLRIALVSLTASNLVITVTNLFRDITVAAAFGAGLESDTFFLAISIPVFILTVSSNAFRSVTVPALEAARSQSDGDYRAVGRRLILNMAWGVIVIAAVSGFVAGVAYVAYRFYDPESFWTGVALFFAAIVPMYAGASLVELLQGPLQVTGRFLSPNLLRLGLPLGIIAGVALQRSSTLYTVAINGMVGAWFTAILAVMMLKRSQFLPTAKTPPLSDEASKLAMGGFRALVVANCITYSRPLIDQWMAGFLGTGATSMLGYANRLTVGIASLVSGSVSQVLLIYFSRLVGQSNKTAIEDTYRLLFRLAPWFGCLATLAVWLTSNLVVALLYQRGKFDASDAHAVAELMNYYALQFPIFWSGIASFTLVSALSMNPVFIRIGIVLVGVNVIGNITLIQLLGLNGIAMSTNLVYFVSIVLLNVALMRRKGIRLDLTDCRAALLPVALLGLAGSVIWKFNLQMDTSNTYGRMLAGLAIFILFSGVAIAVLKPILRQGMTNLGWRFMLR